MTKQAKSGKPYSLECTVNGAKETLRFQPFTMESERSEYLIEQEYGLDENGSLSKEFSPFEKGSTEALLIDFVRLGDVKILKDAGIVLFERPEKGNISRNLAVFDPTTGLSYTIGGVGLIKPTEDSAHFILTDPLLDDEFGAYQEERGNPIGGTQWFSEDGMTASINTSTVGTIEYNSGPYHAERKSLENERLRKLGMNCPRFIAAGPIKNIGDSKFGFTIYRNSLTPEYLPNIGLYIDANGNFKKNFNVYLQSKYSQLYKMHTEIKESHGQPSVTNTLAEINIYETEANLTAQIKDFETNQPIPKNKKCIVLDGVSPTPTGWVVKKSPHAGAQLYDIQFAVLQDFNVVNALINRISDLQQRFNFITQQCTRILLSISQVYPICDPKETGEAIEFAMKTFYEHLKRTNDFSQFNFVISGCFAHRWFANSKQFKGQVLLEYRPETIPSELVDAFKAVRTQNK